MPTVIAVDCSLSMSRTVSVKQAEVGSRITHKQLSQQVYQNVLNYLSTKIKLEYTAVLSFSSTCHRLSEFTRDHDVLKSCINKAKICDKACLEPLFQEIDDMVSQEYGFMVPCNVIIITDGRVNWSADIRSSNLASIVSKLSSDFPLKFISTIHFLSVASRRDLVKSGREALIQAIIKANNGRGTATTLELTNTGNKMQTEIQTMVNAFTTCNLQVFTGKLHCGKLKNEIVLFPCPEKQQIPGDSMFKEMRSVNSDLQIVGFLNISDVKSPPAISRHLVLPSGNNQVTAEEQDEMLPDMGNLPSFIVALHGSLKIENKVASVQVGEDWYGIIGSWTDHKKKSNLILSLFTIGAGCVPWLGLLDNLGPLEGAQVPNDKKHNSAFKQGDVKSYAQNLVVWTKPTGLQTDVQKLLRSAKKLPEKTQVFYKDLNRLRKAALAFGFYELLDGVASILERECTMLPGTSHPEAALQLSHAAQELKTLKGYDNAISPLKTDFKYHSR